jgi:hypothetical protein
MKAHNFFVNESGVILPAPPQVINVYEEPADTPLGFLQLAMEF